MTDSLTGLASVPARELLEELTKRYGAGAFFGVDGTAGTEDNIDVSPESQHLQGDKDASSMIVCAFGRSDRLIATVFKGTAATLRTAMKSEQHPLARIGIALAVHLGMKEVKETLEAAIGN